MKVHKLLLVPSLIAIGSVYTMADSISPSSFSATLNVGESVTITKTVTVSAGPVTSSKVDVFFLMDETGSMNAEIAAVQAAAASIVSSTAGLGDVAFGVGGYRDFDSSSGIGYRQLTDLTTSGAAATTAIGAWATDFGGDYAEANLYALNEVATTTSWRAGSERILVWFGDAPGHDPSGGVTEAAATASLVSTGIAVQAVSVDSTDIESPFGGENSGLNDTGQARRIVDATGGELYLGITTSNIVTTITNAITTAVQTYNSVGLDLSEVPAGVTVGSVPTLYVGALDRSIERTFDFDVTFTGDAPGDYSFNIYGTVDGGRVATEADRITVPGGPSVPSGGQTAVLLGLSLSVLGIARRKVLA
jgi:hypothetical protein